MATMEIKIDAKDAIASIEGLAHQVEYLHFIYSSLFSMFGSEFFNGINDNYVEVMGKRVPEVFAIGIAE